MQVYCCCKWWTFIINSDAQINTITVNNRGTLIVNSPYTLTVGLISNVYIKGGRLFKMVQ
jgi:hypothetical protein